MKLKDSYYGGDQPFEGDRTLWLQSLPAGAVVERAVVTLSPANPSFDQSFSVETTEEDRLLARDWGIIVTNPLDSGWVEVDFHARRMMASVQGSNLANATLQVDLGGGVYVGVSTTGAIQAPGDEPFSLPSDLTSEDDAVLPRLTVNRFRLTYRPPAGETAPDPLPQLPITEVTIRTVPTHVSIKLGETLPIWTRLGELTRAETSPDLAPIFNAFLAESTPENGIYAVPLVIHSDAIASLDVDIELEFVIEQPVLPPHLPEVSLSYDFSTLPKQALNLIQVRLPQNAIPLAERT